VQGAAEGGGERGVGHRFGAGDVDRAGDVGVVEEVRDGGEPVRERDPRHVLAAAAHPPAREELELVVERLEQPAVLGEREAGTRVDHAAAGVLGRTGRGFPKAAEVGQEAVAGRRLLVDRGVAGVAVEVDAGGADERAGFFGGGNGPGECGGRVDAALDEQPLVCGGPPMRADVGAGEIDHRVDVVHDGAVDDPGGRVPAALAGVGRLPADQLDGLVAGVAEVRDEPGAEEAGGAGEQNLHAVIMPGPAPRLHKSTQLRGRPRRRSCRPPAAP
jgi:hypothetical protein